MLLNRPAVGHAQIRVMPNTPCLIGQAASAYVLGNNATGEDAEKVFALISSCGVPILSFFPLERARALDLPNIIRFRHGLYHALECGSML